jgi:hypothetical protein
LTALPIIHFLLRLTFGVTICLLQAAFELIELAVYHIKIIVVIFPHRCLTLHSFASNLDHPAM